MPKRTPITIIPESLTDAFRTKIVFLHAPPTKDSKGVWNFHPRVDDCSPYLTPTEVTDTEAHRLREHRALVLSRNDLFLGFIGRYPPRYMDEGGISDVLAEAFRKARQKEGPSPGYFPPIVFCNHRIFRPNDYAMKIINEAITVAKAKLVLNGGRTS